MKSKDKQADFKYSRKKGFTRKEALADIHPNATKWQRPMKAGKGKPLRKVEKPSQPTIPTASSGGNCLITLIIFLLDTVAVLVTVIYLVGTLNF